MNAIMQLTCVLTTQLVSTQLVLMSASVLMDLWAVDFTVMVSSEMSKLM